MSLFIGNISRTASERDLEKSFEKFGDCHVRFRLGGDTFPPNIYYKVFSKTNVCDINAFAPRDYSSLPR
jgi:hypothetical protein